MTDKFSQPIKEGDFIVYATQQYRSSYLKIGLILEIRDDKGVKVMGCSSSDELQTKPTFIQGYQIMKVPLETVPEAVRNLYGV